jgi:4-amino-4-deoxy-L-arabinose transferase-like glycosyltransferase
MTESSHAASVGPAAPAKPVGLSAAALRGRIRRALPALKHAPLAALLAFAAVLNTHRLSQNGYANIFYSAGVKSMLRSFHNFVFVSFDPGGLITIDKPPLALWLQAASAKLFGFSPLSLLLPEAIAGVLSVAVLYVLLSRRLGPLAGLAGGLALAVFPSFVAVSRDNGVDPLLLLLMILACGAALWAIRDGRLLPLLLCAVLIGLAFNTKTLAAYLVVPGIALGYLLCAPGTLRRRIVHLIAAGALLLIVSAAWITFVELTPASQRPFVGSSTNNTELGLTFEYNGVGRVGGQVGGPGRVPVAKGALPTRETPARAAHRASKAHAPAATRLHSGGLFTALLPDGREMNPIAFGGGTGALRLFGSHLGDQASWMLPFALLSLLAVALALIGPRRGAPSRRRDPRLALAFVFGGWLLVEFVVLSFSKGIVHPYYLSALAPGAAALAGIGAVVMSEFARGRPRDPRVLLLAPAAAATVLAQVLVLHREHYMTWWVPILVAGVALGTLAVMSVRRIASIAMAVTFCLLLVAPAGYATTTWLAPVEGTFPSAGPKQAIGDGGVGVSGRDLHTDRALLEYVRSHRPGSRWAVLTDASETAAPLILLGLDAGALAGYSGTDPALNGPGLARLVARGEARYVVLGGDYSSRGGNLATEAVLRSCKRLRRTVWGGPPPAFESLVLYDCAGRERALADT